MARLLERAFNHNQVSRRRLQFAILGGACYDPDHVLRGVWLPFLWACVIALLILGVIWHADQVLLWLVAFVPVILGVLVIAVPAKHENEQTHMRWRHGLGTVLIVYGALVWVQQTRALNQAHADQEKAVTDTAAKTSAAVSAEVSKTVGAEYQNMIADLNMQIQNLQRQLSDQAKDFAKQLKQQVPI